MVFNVLSEGACIFPILFVDVNNLSHLSNGITSILFISGVLLVSSDLDVQVFGLEITEEIIN